MSSHVCCDSFRRNLSWFFKTSFLTKSSSCSFGIFQYCTPASFPDVSLAAKVVGARGRKGRGKDASLLSPSRDPSLAGPQFLVLLARLLHLFCDWYRRAWGGGRLYTVYSRLSDKNFRFLQNIGKLWNNTTIILTDNVVIDFLITKKKTAYCILHVISRCALHYKKP